MNVMRWSIMRSLMLVQWHDSGFAATTCLIVTSRRSNSGYKIIFLFLKSMNTLLQVDNSNVACQSFKGLFDCLSVGLQDTRLDLSVWNQTDHTSVPRIWEFICPGQHKAFRYHFHTCTHLARCWDWPVFLAFIFIKTTVTISDSWVQCHFHSQIAENCNYRWFRKIASTATLTLKERNAGLLASLCL